MTSKERFNRCKECEHNGSVCTQDGFKLLVCHLLKGKWTAEIDDCPLKYIDLAKHCIGLDYKKPYIRHEKQFYKPYRNYFCTFPDDKLWNELEKQGYAKHSKENNGCVDFYLTRKGLDWFGNILDCKIYDYR